MTYHVKEIFYTLQGEGAQTGRAAVFCRFAGCNLWSGNEADRATALCQFCDTDFNGTTGTGGGKFTTAEDLVTAITQTWQAKNNIHAQPYVVCTGGEPLLQIDNALITALHQANFNIAIETNGTQTAPTGIDWICVSPKARAPLILTAGHELKLVYPQEDALPEQFIDLDFQHFFLQPMDGNAHHHNTQLAIQYCLDHPQWRLCLQTHKLIGIP
ncbi:7-carboxy-7-deazaguanine synthase [Beggiatoa leptomitoformis]|uniref:7-carboxy-7-deazaguanine synthase n=1 Tax=Beggiatoa leptomitoformis TaxID=288004 RepID=A0A2N9YGU8_9GAMM|nr:7-carboxy-7-deazaguanine synthase [Beggiatoa leptomitoformis]ALG68020.1 7-carboxy-7-deazaguanine synthase [Beggiatoa leptomitoformis]AUI69693.1 7-carboxy-7-deazaguanine synthase [Beggiatoa leptomitoformis]